MKIEAKIEAGASGEIIEGQVDVSVTTDEVKVEVKEEAPADEGQCTYTNKGSLLYLILHLRCRKGRVSLSSE